MCALWIHSDPHSQATGKSTSILRALEPEKCNEVVELGAGDAEATDGFGNIPVTLGQDVKHVTPLEAPRRLAVLERGIGVVGLA